jgi:putative acetyltransferase
MTFEMMSERPGTDIAQRLKRLFISTFSDSEGADEGMLIGKLVQDFLEQTRTGDLHIAVENEGPDIIASAIFSRFTCADDTDAWLMAPVAVATHRQGNGVGQALISHAIDRLRAYGATLILTYGDINFYGKTGFVQISEDLVPAPLPLSYPDGWMGRAADGTDIKAVKGPTHCVKAIGDPRYW